MSRTRKLTRPRLPQCTCGARHAPDTFACDSAESDAETFATVNLQTYAANERPAQ